MRRLFSIIASSLLLTVALSSCQEKLKPEDPVVDGEIYYINFFAFNAMNTYYLWVDEVQDAMNAWERNADPVESVYNVRYKDRYGVDIDRWTQMITDYDAFTSSVGGVETTYGFDFQLYYFDQSKDMVCAVVTLVYAGSPAENAGLHRGDVIMSVNGKTMTEGNYRAVVTDELFGGSRVSLGLQRGETLDLEAVKMYEDPVLVTKVFNCPGGKKVGYLAYTSFTIKSARELVQVCLDFRKAGVSELILDLRYNSGGYVITENVLASMLAPEEEVLAGSVFEKEIYNAALTKELGSGVNKFKTNFRFTADGEGYDFTTLGANIGLSKIYAIIDSGTASASESLLTGLMPYMDVVLIGGQSHGKYCGGIMYSAKEWYQDNRKYMDEDVYEAGIKQAGKWGIYVIYERYADKDGVTPCMPDGFVPDISVEDTPLEARELGDPRETMLAVALEQAGYVAPSPSTTLSAGSPAAALPGAVRIADAPKKAAFGVRLELPR